MEPSKMTSITTIGKLGDYWVDPFFGSLGVQGMQGLCGASHPTEGCLFGWLSRMQGLGFRGLGYEILQPKKGLNLIPCWG